MTGCSKGEIGNVVNWRSFICIDFIDVSSLILFYQYLNSRIKLSINIYEIIVSHGIVRLSKNLLNYVQYNLPS